LTSIYQAVSHVLVPIDSAIGGVQALISLLCAELFLILARNREIVVILKANSQRTAPERTQVARGLFRSIILEICLFAPASVFLVLVIVRPLLVISPAAFVFKSELSSLSVSGLLGVIGYEFPFSTVRRVVTRMALETLQKFASISIGPD
jgi:hypothetical protein